MKYNLGDLVFTLLGGRIKQGQVVGRHSYERFSNTDHAVTTIDYDVDLGWSKQELCCEDCLYPTLEQLPNALTDYYDV
jgi:hypothetical protein